MSITVQFTTSMLRDNASLNAEMVFENFTHLRDAIRPFAFAPVYRMRSHENSHGRITSREFNAVMCDGREVYLGNITMEGDTQ